MMQTVILVGGSDASTGPGETVTPDIDTEY